MKYRADIDGLRAVAVLPVVLYHAGFPGISGGYLGVDVFFVISGFLITSIVAKEVQDGRFSLWSFYERRARRILPALTVVLLFTILVGWFVLLPKEYRDLGESTLAATLFLSNFYFTAKLDYFGPAAEFSPLLHTWSLAVEEQFYLFFPPMLAALFTWKGRKAVLYAVMGLSAVSLAAAEVMLPQKPDWVFYLIFFRAWELGVGALLALSIYPAPQNRMMREAIGIAGILAILVPVVTYSSTTSFPGLAAIPPVLGSAAIIYVGTNGLGSVVSRFLANRLFVWVGLISYSLYLWHWPILSFLRIVRADVDLPLAIGFAAVAASILASWASYRFVETPFRAKPPKGFSQRAIFSLSGTMLLGMVLVGGLLHLTSGIPSRLSPKVSEIAAFSSDRNPDLKACFGILPKDGLCSLGAPAADDGTAQFLFWGDSHAEAMKYGLDLAAASKGQTGLFAGTIACPPIRQIQRSSESRNCTAMNQAVWTFLQNRDDLGVVVLAARWALAVEGTRYGQEPGAPVVLEWAGGPERRPEKRDNASLVESGLAATVEEIVATGRTVVILGPIPEVGWRVPNVLARGEMLGWLAQPPEFSEADFAKRSAATEEMLKRVAANFDGVRYIQLSDLFCVDGTCAITDDDGKPYYADDDHISRTAAGALLPERMSEIWEN